MNGLRLVGVLVLLGLVAPAAWVATALPVLAQDGDGGDSDGGDAEGDADQAASDEDEDEADVRARAANGPQGNPFQGVPADPWQAVTGNAAPSFEAVTVSPPGSY